MPTPRVARAGELAAQLTGSGIPTTSDPRLLAGRLPGALLGPPRLTFDAYGGPTATWRLLLVADTAHELAAWEQLDTLLDLLEQQLPLDSAEPASYATSAAADPLPAYAVTFTD